MNKLFSRKTSSLSGLRLKSFVSASLVLAAAVALTPAALADAFTFNVSGSGITAAGVITATPTGPNGAYTITGISGTFSDLNNGFTGTISGLSALAGPIVLNSSPDPVGTFAPPSPAGTVFSYDNLFYPSGNSFAVCKDAQIFFGGFFDVYGLSFTVAGTGNVDTVDIWSNGSMGGYMVGDQYQGTKLSPTGEAVGYPVSVTAHAPEPSSFLLLGTGLPGLIAVWRRKGSA